MGRGERKTTKKRKRETERDRERQRERHTQRERERERQRERPREVEEQFVDSFGWFDVELHAQGAPVRDLEQARLFLALFDQAEVQRLGVEHQLGSASVHLPWGTCVAQTACSLCTSLSLRWLRSASPLRHGMSGWAHLSRRVNKQYCMCFDIDIRAVIYMCLVLPRPPSPPF